MTEPQKNMTEDDIEDIEIETAESEPEEQGPIIALEDPAEQKRVIEALLFASPDPMPIKAIRQRLPESADVGGILIALKEEYATRGVHLVQLEDSWCFRTAPDLGASLAMTKKEEKKLSRAALETMSIIAYHQPVTRAEIENIRGVATSKGTLDVLMEAKWIKPGRRRETPGRPLTWLTTTTFLDDFGIENLSDLPGLSELKAAGLLDTRPAIDTIPGADLFTSANENAPQEEDDAADIGAEDKFEPREADETDQDDEEENA